MDLKKDYTKHEELSEMCKPLQEWLLKHFNPHTEIVIDVQGVSVKESTLFTRIG